MLMIRSVFFFEGALLESVREEFVSDEPVGEVPDEGGRVSDENLIERKLVSFLMFHLLKVSKNRGVIFEYIFEMIS